MTEKESKFYREEFDRIIRTRFNEGIKSYMANVKAERGLSDEDIEALVGIKMSEDQDIRLDNLSGLETMRIIELCSDEEPTVKLIEAYKEETRQLRLMEKLDMLLEIFNICDEKSLDRLLDKAISVRNAFNDHGDKPDTGCNDSCKSQDDTKSECKSRKEECCERNSKAECGHDDEECKCGGFEASSYYDSETMDEPEVRFNELTQEESMKILSEAMGNLEDSMKSLTDLTSKKFGLPLF